LDNCSQIIKEINEQIKQYKFSLIKNAFRGILTKNWRLNNKKMVDDILETINIKKENFEDKYKQHNPVDLDFLMDIPKEWKWTTIGFLSESMKNGIYKPKSFYSDSGIACLRMYNIENGKLVWKDVKRMNLTNDEIVEYEMKPNDLLINRVNSRELVGKTAVIPEGIERCVYESKNIRLRLFDSFMNSKLVSFWFFIFHQKYFNRNAQQTVGMASINQEQLSSMPIPYMTPEEQIEIVNFLEQHISEIEQLNNFIELFSKKLYNLRSIVLTQAFEGKLVPQDPNDKPVSELLKRIKETVKN